MEPRALVSANTTPFRDSNDNSNDTNPSRSALHELSINKGKSGLSGETEMKTQRA
jgi:hypothetical protein